MKRRWILVVLALAGLVAVGVVWWYSPIFELPAPGGPHRVGVKAFALVDESREGLLGTPAGEPRRIPIRVWYPVADDARGPTRPYLDGYEAASLGQNFGKGRHFFAYLSRIDTHSTLDAPVKRGPGAWPLVLFNHGFWCYPEQNTALMEQLASHGYVAVSIGHPGDSIEARFADGTAVKPFHGSDEKRDAELQAGVAAFMGGATGDARVTGLKRFEAASMAHRIGDSAASGVSDNLFCFSGAAYWESTRRGTTSPLRWTTQGSASSACPSAAAPRLPFVRPSWNARRRSISMARVSISRCTTSSFAHRC